jgi:hypothetical protein
MKHLFPFCACLCLLFFGNCRSQRTARDQDFVPSPAPSTPDYAQASSWAALPTLRDPADRVPSATLTDEQANAPADVFFVHPTTYTSRPTSPQSRNADIADAKLNQKTDESTILNQASLFNGAGRVYAPRYRQAHIRAYYAEQAVAKQVFELAYQDVKRAFEHYLAHYNQGRPIILAAHSQGTQHARRLLAELFDGQPLARQLVVAYLVGMPVPADAFRAIPLCQSADQTGCFCTWNTYATGHYPRNHASYLAKAAVTNPLTWTTGPQLANRSLNQGAVGRNFKFYANGFIDAQINQGMLWVHKPRIAGRALVNIKNWHVADYNFFYANVRQNARARVERFGQSNGK